MKNKLTKLALALPLVLAATTSQATYTIRIAMETTGGGSLPAGSIVFSNKDDAPVGPVTPTEPEVVDPFEPEDNRCDPYATTWPEAFYGREKDTPITIYQSDADNPSGKIYQACKLKEIEKPNLLLRYQDGISVRYFDALSSKWVEKDECDVNFNPLISSSNKCSVRGGYTRYEFNVMIDANGFKLTPRTVYVNTILIEAKIAMADVGRIVIDGVECTNIRQEHAYGGNKGPVIQWSYMCDYNVSYDDVIAKRGQPYITEIYGK